jgi:hypothetical protein
MEPTARPPSDDRPLEPKDKAPARDDRDAHPTRDQVEGVRRHRRHIEGLDGKDPLRGGIDD